MFVFPRLFNTQASNFTPTNLIYHFLWESAESRVEQRFLFFHAEGKGEKKEKQS